MANPKGFKIVSSIPRFVKRMKRTANNATEKLSSEFLKMCDPYTRFDTGELMRSAKTASQFKEGRLIWDTPYARRVYYTGVPSKDKHPKATLQWADVAYKNNRKRIAEMADKLCLKVER